MKSNKLPKSKKDELIKDILELEEKIKSVQKKRKPISYNMDRTSKECEEYYKKHSKESKEIFEENQFFYGRFLILKEQEKTVVEEKKGLARLLANHYEEEILENMEKNIRFGVKFFYDDNYYEFSNKAFEELERLSLTVNLSKRKYIRYSLLNVYENPNLLTYDLDDFIHIDDENHTLSKLKSGKKTQLTLESYFFK